MKIAILSNFTTDFLTDKLKKTYGLEVTDFGYNKYSIELFDPNSKIYKENYDFTFLLLDGEYLLFNRTFDDVVSEIQGLVNSFINNSTGKLFISNILFYNYSNKIADYNDSNSFKNYQLQINSLLSQISLKNKNIYVLDILSLIEKYGFDQLFDDGLWHYAAYRYNELGTKKISELIYTYVNAAINNAKKCLIVDLDNTLWGGVLGEEGHNNIALGKDRIGNIYTKIQQIILSIKNRGIILCICSKNNFNDVKEAFEKNTNFVLKLNDFVIKKINWLQKDINIKEIVKELNIGEDSCVFVDDSPFERELVKNSSYVVVPDYPKSVDNLIEFWQDLDFKYFSKLSLTQEDLEKTKQYEANILREELKNSYSNIDDYLKSLKLELTIGTAKKEHIPRLAQLANKTNQFNFTTIRYTESELEKYLTNPNFKVYYLKLKDNFGDYGIIGLIVLHELDAIIEIETFLLSCRVIGRKIEHAVIYELKKMFDKRFIGKFIPTAKNIILKDKYDELGFSLIEEIEGIKTYILSDLPSATNNIIEVHIEN